MTTEIAVLKALSSYDNYKKHRNKLDKHQLSKESNWLLKQMDKWFKEKEKDIDWNLFIEWIVFTNDLKDGDIYVELCRKIDKGVSDIDNDIIRHWVICDTLGDIQYLLDCVLDGDSDFETIKPTLDSYIKSLEVDDEEDNEYIKTINNVEFDNIVNPEYKWKLNCLQDCSGGYGAGDFVTVFGRPNSGKTSFIVSETASVMKTLKQPIVWFNNEEAAEKIILRYISVLANKPTINISKNIEFYKQKYKNMPLVTYDKAMITKKEVEDIIEKYNPSMVVFNNLDKIQKGRSEAMYKEVGLLYQWARELAKENNMPVFAVCQASGEAEGKRVLYQSMTQDSKTDKQGEGDMIIGIGREDGEDNLIDDAVLRYINVCKNKTTEGRIEGLREIYGRAVRFHSRVGLYEDEGKDYVCE